MRYVIQAFGAVVGFALTFVACVAILATMSWMQNSPLPLRGSMVGILAAAAVGLTMVGARLGWQLARRWSPKR